MVGAQVVIGQHDAKLSRFLLHHGERNLETILTITAITIAAVNQPQAVGQFFNLLESIWLKLMPVG